MAKIKIILIKIITTLLLCVASAIANATIHIVAAENVYGATAKELGGANVEVINILNNPNTDPHLFVASVSTAQAITMADIIIYNGADYDAWIQPLLAIPSAKKREVINVAALMHMQPGANPHLWYKPETMPQFATQLVTLLKQLDPTNQSDYAQHLLQFNRDYQPLFTMINQLKQRFQNTPIIATEPIFNYMADSIGLVMHGNAFQNSIMNDVPPAVSQIKAFEDDLTQHNVHLLIYNNQVINPLTQRMLSLAKEQHIPIVGVSEMLPADTTYINWMLKQLTDLNQALASYHA